jgi:hypothetical protein
MRIGVQNHLDLTTFGLKIKNLLRLLNLFGVAKGWKDGYGICVEGKIKKKLKMTIRE